MNTELRTIDKVLVGAVVVLFMFEAFEILSRTTPVQKSTVQQPFGALPGTSPAMGGDGVIPQPSFASSEGIVQEVGVDWLDTKARFDQARVERIRVTGITHIVRTGDKKSDEQMQKEIREFQVETARRLESAAGNNQNVDLIVSPSPYVEESIVLSDIQRGESVSILHKDGVAVRVIVNQSSF